MNNTDTSPHHRPTTAELRQHCALLLSHFAWAEHRQQQAASDAYQQGIKLAPLDQLPPLLPQKQVCDLEVDQALNYFAGTKTAFRQRLFLALSAVSRHDNIITAQERRLIHHFADALQIDHETVESALTLPKPGSRIEANEPGTESAPSSLAEQQSAFTQGSIKQALFPGPLSIPAKALILANIIPLFGVIFLGWDAGALLLLYWLENIVIGVYTIVRMIYACGIKAIGIVIFFTFHYSAFCGVHGMIVLSLSTLVGESEILNSGADDGLILLMPFLLVAEVFRNIIALYPALLTLPLLSFVISHGISTVMNNFIGKEDIGRKAESIMADPYRRIVILHVALIAGAGVILLGNAGSIAPVLILLIAMKTALDLYEHNRNHRNRLKAKAQANINTT